MEPLYHHVLAIPFFSGLDQPDIEALVSISREKGYAKGCLIFSEGDPGDGFYVVTEGLVKIFKVSPEGKEQILHMLGPGEPFGEVAVFQGWDFPANALAVVKTSVLFFPRKKFKQKIAAHPDLALRMLAVLSLRLREFTIQVESISLKEVPARLAVFLLERIENTNSRKKVMDRTESGSIRCAEVWLDIGMSKANLSNYLGTTPETLSRALSWMKENHIIEMEKRKIRILDKEALKALARS